MPPKLLLLLPYFFSQQHWEEKIRSIKITLLLKGSRVSTLHILHILRNVLETWISIIKYIYTTWSFHLLIYCLFELPEELRSLGKKQKTKMVGILKRFLNVSSGKKTTQQKVREANQHTSYTPYCTGNIFLRKSLKNLHS